MAAKKPKKAAVPKPEALAAQLGVKLTKELTGKQAQSLRKGLPGFASQLDNAAEALEASKLPVKDITPDSLRDVQTRRSELLAREQVLYRVWRSVYHQRLVADDEAMGMLQKLVRRVEALSEDDPSLEDDWKVILDFFKTFHRKAATDTAEEDPTPPEA